MERFARSFLSDQDLVGCEIKKAIAWLAAQNVERSVLADVEIVLAEAMNNIVEHAYLFRKDGLIDLKLYRDAQNLLIELRDKGEKLVSIPQKKVMKGAAVKFEDLPEGGFGWFLIHSLASDIEYQMIDDENVLKLGFVVA